jgi:hypothetical protein
VLSAEVSGHGRWAVRRLAGSATLSSWALQSCGSVRGLARGLPVQVRAELASASSSQSQSGACILCTYCAPSIPHHPLLLQGLPRRMLQQVLISCIASLASTLYRTVFPDRVGLSSAGKRLCAAGVGTSGQGLLGPSTLHRHYHHPGHLCIIE